MEIIFRGDQTAQDRALQIFAATPTSLEIARTELPVLKEDDTLTGLLSAVEALKESHIDYDKPQYAGISAEWVYVKSAASQGEFDGPTILYIHGGGFLHGSPGTARRITRRLADISRGRCLAIKYRYCTEQPFPGAILDALVTYLLPSSFPSLW